MLVCITNISLQSQIPVIYGHGEVQGAYNSTDSQRTKQQVEVLYSTHHVKNRKSKSDNGKTNK